MRITYQKCKYLAELSSLNNLNNFIAKRFVYKLSGQWDHTLTVDVKKNIEKYWSDTVKTSHEKRSKENDEKMYISSMFPYPSGKLHMGHVRVYSISDAMVKFHLLRGKKVIHPMGWDSFGLPAENAAIERGIPPDVWTQNNIAKMKEQFSTLGVTFDWEREINTCSKDYYKWTQFLFLKLMEHGLVYRKEAVVNWDPIDQTVLADEQVNENMQSWRTGAIVEKRKLKQWFVSTTKYSKSLLDGLNDPSLINWKDITSLQRHWIGDCTGYRFHFPIKGDASLPKSLDIWTEKPELLCGAAYIVISPSHHLNNEIYYTEPSTSSINSEDIKMNFVAVHPITGRDIPVFLSHKIQCIPGTESYIGIPEEVPEDKPFAEEHGICGKQVLENEKLINSEQFSGLDVGTARGKIVEEAQLKKFGGFGASSKLRDWLVSRQRYWGTPIPIIHCDSCGEVPVPMESLPVVLPKIEESQLKEGRASLASLHDWINTDCPKCGRKAKRETDTLDTFFDSSWYYMRYLSPNNESELVSKEDADAYMPVDLYIGGKEHATLHLYYARFMSHFCNDIGIVKTREPFHALIVQGMVIAKTYQAYETKKFIPYEEVDFSVKERPVMKGTDNRVSWNYQKMSKSKHNGIEPQHVIDTEGIDTVRLLMLAYHNPTSDKRWPVDGYNGIDNFQRRLWNLVRNTIAVRLNLKDFSKQLNEDQIKKFNADLYDARNYYLKAITHHFLRTYQLNVSITKMMGLLGSINNVHSQMAQTSKEFENALGTLILASAPIVPHFATELWSRLSSVYDSNDIFNWNEDIWHQKWPQVDMDYELNLAVSMNKRDIGTFKLKRKDLEALTSETAIKLALNSKEVQNNLVGYRIKDTSFVLLKEYKGLVNIIVSKIVEDTLSQD